MRTLNQKGSGLVEIILILVVIAILGFTGWFVWHSKQSANKTLGETEKSSTQAPVTKKSNASQQSDTSNYVDIKEWGVKLVVPAEVSDTYYSYKQVSDEESYVYLSTRTLTNLDPMCAANQSSPSAVTRVSVAELKKQRTDPDVSAFIPPDNAGTYIDNYFFYVTKGNGTCGSTEAVINKEGAAKIAYSKIKVVKQ